MTIAQIVHDNELFFGLSEEQIHTKALSLSSIIDFALILPMQLLRIWDVMDECIRTGVSTSEQVLPGRLGLRRRAPMLYRRLMRGYQLPHYDDMRWLI
jgi:L-serine deaminase